MVYIFQILSTEVPDFKRIIEINPEDTFADLHLIIQNSSNFSSDQIASFFITDNSWRKEVEVTLLDMGPNHHPTFTMNKTQLRKLIDKEGQRLLYVFDFFNDRSYNLELIEISMKKDLKEPYVSFAEGESPVQILENDYIDQGYDILDEEYRDFGELEDYTEIYGEMEDLTFGG